MFDLSFARARVVIPHFPGLPLLFCIFWILCLLILSPQAVHAGGPKYVAGVSFFNPSVLGRPVRWANGQVNYYVDQGDLNSSVTNQQATAMVDAAAALWSAVPTSGVTLTNMGPLNEDVNGANVAAVNGQITQPADVTPAATGHPLGVIYDADGSVIDAIFGANASDPTSCQNNGVMTWMDNLNPDATFAHGILVLNGRCATNAALLQMMSYELERAFGRVLGLDYAQVNPTALTDLIPGGIDGWPVMQPLSGVCTQTGGICIANPGALRFDDIAALNRIYPITAQNLSAFPGKVLTAANTVSIQGTVSFRSGVGMQGVNVTARPLDANGNPLYQYAVSFVSGGYFNGNHGNPMTGWVDQSGNRLDMWGANDPALQGFFDLSGMPLPPGMTSAAYQVTFEAVDPLYILEDSVGPYLDGQVTPSGTLTEVTVGTMNPGDSQTLTVKASDSATAGFEDAIGTEAAARAMPASGMWCGRLSQVGQSDWFSFPVRGGRTFTVVTQALDESGAPTESKAMPSLGVWDAFDAVGAPAVGAAPGMNGLAIGESWLRITSLADDLVRIGIADQRGDGRPDYAYNGWVLYADTVAPQRLPAAGGPIVIHGMGFRLADTVLVNGQPALVTSISPNEITAVAPAAGIGVTGSVDVEVDDLPAFYAAAIVSGGVSYDSGTGDALTLVTAPANTVPLGVPIPFTVTALGPDLTPAAGVTVTYSITAGIPALGCGKIVCSVVTTGDGRATMNVAAADGNWSIVTAALTNGSSLQAQFAGGTPPVLAALTPQLSLAAGATLNWPVQALVLNNGIPMPGQSVSWQAAAAGISAQASVAALTGSDGVASNILQVGPLAEGQQASATACLNGTSQCVSFNVLGARPEYASLHAVSGTTQSLSAQGTAAPIVLRVLDMDGNFMAGAQVVFDQALYAWAPPCGVHSVCTQGTLLATQTTAAVSGLDGTVTFTPASLSGVATNLVGLAATGNTATVNVAVEQHP